MSATPAAPAATTPRGSRVHVLDGIRGIALVLVLLHHAWILTPTSDITARPLRVLVTSGDYAVTAFLVVSGFLAMRAVLNTEARTGAVHFGVITLRRWARLAGQVYVLLAAVAITTAVLPGMAPGSAPNDPQGMDAQNTGMSLWRILTFTWPSYVIDHPMEARSDLGHLWYVSADLWGVAAMALLAFFFARRRAVLGLALVGAIALCTIYRFHMVSSGQEWDALLSLPARVDGLFWGALAAVAVPWLESLRGKLTGVAPLLLVGLVAVMWFGNGPVNYLQMGGLTFNLLFTALVLTTALGGATGMLGQVLGHPVLAWLGTMSLAVYLWHYPVWFYIARNHLDWEWPFEDRFGWPWSAQLALGLAVTAALAMLSVRLVERPLQVKMTSPWWRNLDHGLVVLLGDRSRQIAGRVSDRVGAATAQARNKPAPAPRAEEAHQEPGDPAREEAPVAARVDPEADSPDEPADDTLPVAPEPPTT